MKKIKSIFSLSRGPSQPQNNFKGFFISNSCVINHFRFISVAQFLLSILLIFTCSEYPQSFCDIGGQLGGNGNGNQPHEAEVVNNQEEPQPVPVEHLSNEALSELTNTRRTDYLLSAEKLDEVCESLNMLDEDLAVHKQKLEIVREKYERLDHISADCDNASAKLKKEFDKVSSSEKKEGLSDAQEIYEKSVVQAEVARNNAYVPMFKSFDIEDRIRGLEYDRDEQCTIIEDGKDE